MASAFDRMSKREKVMVASLGGVVLVFAVLMLYLWIGRGVAELETQVQADRSMLREIQLLAPRYIKATRSQASSLKSVEANEEINLKLAVNKLAKLIDFEGIDNRGEPTSRRKLADVIAYQQTQDKQIKVKKDKGKKAKKKKKDAVGGYYERHQTVKLNEFVPFKAIYELLEKVEADEQMLFVTSLKIRKKFRDGRYAKKNAEITVSTYYYRGKDE